MSQYRCVECGHDTTNQHEHTEDCRCCKTFAHCVGCEQPTVKLWTYEQTGKCVCCGECEQYPCACESIEPDYDDDDDNDDDDGYGSSAYVGYVLPWASKYEELTALEYQNDDWNKQWPVERLDIARAAATFYVLDLIRTGQALPVPATKTWRQAFASISRDVAAKAIGASNGVVTGRIYFDSGRAVEAATTGHKVILVKPETRPDDTDAMKAAVGVLTTKGGRASHAAVICRMWNKPSVVGAQQLGICDGALRFPDGRQLAEGDELTIDGSTGEIMLANGENTDLAETFTEPYFGTLHNWELRKFLSDKWTDLDYLRRNYRPRDIVAAESAELQAIRAEAEVQFKDLCNWLAPQLFMAGTLAVGGELRHHKALGNKVLSGNRRAAWAGWKKMCDTLGDSFALSCAEAIFDDGTWDGGFGGAKWADCSKVCRMFIDGEFSDDELVNKQLFIDRVFNCVHNGGPLLNKLEFWFKPVNKRGWNVSHLQAKILPAHGGADNNNEPDFKVLLSVCSDDTVALFKAYWTAANYERSVRGHNEIVSPATPGAVRYICNYCESDPTIGHFHGCYSVTGATDFDGGDLSTPKPWFSSVYEDEWANWSWSKWKNSKKSELPLGPDGKQIVSGEQIIHVFATLGNGYGDEVKLKFDLPVSKLASQWIVASDYAPSDDLPKSVQGNYVLIEWFNDHHCMAQHYEADIEWALFKNAAWNVGSLLAKKLPGMTVTSAPTFSTSKFATENNVEIVKQAKLSGKKVVNL